MSALARQKLLTFDEYLDFEATSPVRHEYHEGRLVEMMAGVSPAHDAVHLTVASAIRAKLGVKGPCRVHQSGLSLRIDAADAGFYPDIFVTCDPRDRNSRAKQWPCLIIEVLSKSTRDYDRGDKFDAYKLIDALSEYVLIDTEGQAVSVHRPLGPGRWESVSLGPSDVLELHTIGLSLSVESIYEGADVPLVRPRPKLVAPIAED